MPPISEIKTIEHMIFYQYAKIMAKSAFGHKDGKEAKAKNFGFIRNTVRKLINGKKWSDISREDWQFVEAEKKCFYCGSTENLEKEHIVPKCIKINQSAKIVKEY